ncbi:hypothetical protein PtA15_7A691 [Puccinia triticina]|uniref:Uncharacterized protein n=1 Tax=Puccinia triticina TaxID=208348 RepID=A0ABY7CR68_9BASI|nr:uncharacterized protein PtA15_7A691 [Puccinia triticina]WAQ86962.1 hypothetical protein PtA15_7A691 [Puccinia triticina]
MFNLIAETTSAVKQAAGVGSLTVRSQVAEQPKEAGQTQGLQESHEEHPDEVAAQGAVQEGPKTVQPKKTKKVTIAKTTTRKIATRSSLKAPEEEGEEIEIGVERDGKERARGKDVGLGIWELPEGGAKEGAGKSKTGKRFNQLEGWFEEGR